EMLRVPAQGPKPLDDVLFELQQLPLDAALEPVRWPWLEVRVHLDEPQPEPRTRIDRALRSRPVRLLKINDEHVGVDASFGGFPHRRELDRIDPQQVFIDCYERGYGSKPDAELLEAFNELREAVHLDEGQG